MPTIVRKADDGEGGARKAALAYFAGENPSDGADGAVIGPLDARKLNDHPYIVASTH